MNPDEQNNIPTEETPTEETPTEETPTGETPTEETPTEETPTEETPTEETPTEETPTGETPTGETPTDTTISISTEANSIPEGNEGDEFPLLYTISLDRPAERDVQVALGFNRTGNGQNVSFDDSVSIPTGQQSVVYEAGTISGDDVAEEDESTTISIQRAFFNDESEDLTISDSQSSATITVTDDDGEEPTSNITANLSVDAESIQEGDEGETSVITYTVTLSEPVPDQAVRGIISVETDGAVEGEITFDDGVDDGLDIPAGETTGTFTYEFTGDNTEEPDETVTASLEFVGLMDDGSGNGRNETFSLDSSSVSTTIFDDDGETSGGDETPGGGGSNTVYRFFNPTAGVHFYTDDENERQFIQDNLDIYDFEGASYRSVDPLTGGAEDVYRFFNESTGVHLYSTDENERDFIIDNLDQFAFEGTAFNAYETQVEGSIPVFRFFEPNLGVHFYTPSESERDFVDAELGNYQSEGIAYYALPLEGETI